MTRARRAPAERLLWPGRASPSAPQLSLATRMEDWTPAVAWPPRRSAGRRESGSQRPWLCEAAPQPEGSSVCAQQAPARLGFPGALPQRRVVWMWFGAFPGAFGLGKAQPQDVCLPFQCVGEAAWTLSSSRPHCPSHSCPNSPLTFLSRPAVLCGEEAATAAHPGARLGGKADPGKDMPGCQPCCAGLKCDPSLLVRRALPHRVKIRNSRLRSRSRSESTELERPGKGWGRVGWRAHLPSRPGHSARGRARRG